MAEKKKKYLDTSPIVVHGTEEEEFVGEIEDEMTEDSDGFGPRDPEEHIERVRRRVVGAYESRVAGTESAALRVAVSQLLIAVYALWRVVRSQVVGKDKKASTKELANLEKELAEIRKGIVLLAKRSSAGSLTVILIAAGTGLAAGLLGAFLVRLFLG